MYRQNAFVKILSKTGRFLGTRKDNPSIVDFGNNNNAIRNQKHFKPVTNGNNCNWTRTQNDLARNEHSTIWPNWPKDCVVFWVLICTVHLTACSLHVTYAFQREYTLYICLNAKELLSRSRRKIWSLCDCNWFQPQNYLVRKWTLTIWPNWPNDWGVFWVLICTVQLTVCSCSCGFTLKQVSHMARTYRLMARLLIVAWLP